MSAFFNHYTTQTYAWMRIVTGVLMLCHGSQIVLGFPGAAHETPAFITYGAGSIELIGGILVAVGLFTGWAAFV